MSITRCLTVQLASLALSLTFTAGAVSAQSAHVLVPADHDGAEVLLSALLAKNPANWDAHLVRAASLHARGSHEKALASLFTLGTGGAGAILGGNH